jgi:hypothetical protein
VLSVGEQKNYDNIKMLHGMYVTKKTQPSNSGIILVSSSLRMGSKGYSETSHLSIPTPCHDPKALQHKDENRWSFVLSSMCTRIIKLN